MSDFKRFAFTWLILFIVIEVIMSIFGIGRSTKNPNDILTNSIILEASSNKITQGKRINIKIDNETDSPIDITNKNCLPPFQIFNYISGAWNEVKAVRKTPCTEELSMKTTLESGSRKQINLDPWDQDLFKQIGRYKVVYSTEEKEYTSPEFIIKKRGFIKRTWDIFFHKPIYNALLYFTAQNPTHNLGISIIILTFIIRLMLLLPSQKALKSQRKMNNIQPRIEEIKKKYEGNQEKIAMETMKIWKDSKVNPMGSCLPMLLQFPVLIALYYSVRDVITADGAHLLYEAQRNFDFSIIQTIFIGNLDLAKKNIIVLPVIVGLLQFTQMRLTFKNKGKSPKKDKSKPSNGAPDMNVMNKTMSYTLPIMIAFFTASLPAGVGLYWGTSTLFGIGQALSLSKEKKDPKDKVSNSSSVTVKVIDQTIEEKRREEKKKYLPKKKKKSKN